ncbi:MAG: hypothetical protein R2839_10495 [Thermomicrobiales bacterium]
MAVSQAPVGIEKPLTLAIQGAGGEATSSAPGTLVVEQVAGGDTSDVLAVMATSYHAQPNRQLEQMAVDVVRDSLRDGSAQHLSDVMRSGFRNANRVVRDASSPGEGEGIAMLALATRGKYATLALIGPDRGYLARAGRLNQVTRDQSAVVSRSRRKQHEQTPAAGVSRLLGEAERLDAKSPAIFELTLLPEDRLVLLSRDLIDLVGEGSLLSGLQSGVPGLVAAAGGGGDSAVMAALVSVAPIRETASAQRQPVPQAKPMWMFAAPVLLLLIILASAVYFLL